MTEKKDVKFFDLFNPKTPKTMEEKYAERIAICASCEHLIQPTFRCSKCGCFMKLKAKLEDAKCPVQKWPE